MRSEFKKNTLFDLAVKDAFTNVVFFATSNMNENMTSLQPTDILPTHLSGTRNSPITVRLSAELTIQSILAYKSVQPETSQE